MLGLTDTLSTTTSQLCYYSAKRAMLNKWAQLCVNKTLFIKIGIGNSLPVPTLIHPIFPDVPLDCARIQKPSFPHSRLLSATPENATDLFPLSWVSNMGQILLALGRVHQQTKHTISVLLELTFRCDIHRISILGLHVQSTLSHFFLMQVNSIIIILLRCQINCL